MTASEITDTPSEPMGPLIGEYRSPIAHRKLRVLYVWDADYPWDVRTEKICATLASAGHDVHIAARNVRREPTVERLPEGTVHRMPPMRWAGRAADSAFGFPAFFNPRWLSLLDRTVRRVRPDVVVCRDVPLAPTSLWAGHRHGIPVVLDIAENYPAMLRMVFDAGVHRPTDHLVRNPTAAAFVERYSLRRADRVLVVIEEMAERMVRMGIPADRIDVVSNTPPRLRAEPEPERRRRPAGQPLGLMYLGHLEVPRGLLEMVDAVALLRREGFPVRATRVGKGRDAQLFKDRAREHGLSEAEVSFLGYVDREAALRAVQEADIGVLPHHVNEQWNTSIPNKLFDYMAVGLPVLSSNPGPFERITRATGAGEVFQAGDARSLADAVLRLSDADVRERYGAAGRRAILERYNWEYDTAVLMRALDRAANISRGNPRG
jgi:glycosyltransferase involved in cell wall biosynthesis